MRDTRPDGDGAPEATTEGGAWRALAASVEAWLPEQVRTGGRPAGERRRDAGERR